MDAIFMKHIKKIAMDKEFQELACRIGVPPKLIYGKVGEHQLQNGQPADAICSFINSGFFSKALESLLELIDKESGFIPEGELLNNRSLDYLPFFKSIPVSIPAKSEEQSAFLLIKQYIEIERLIDNEDTMDQAAITFEDMLDISEEFGPRASRSSRFLT